MPDPGIRYDVGVSADGTAVAVWRLQTESHGYLKGARRPPGGKWSRPTVIARVGGHGTFSLVNIVVDDLGNVAVASIDRARDGHKFRQVVRTWRSDGSVEPAAVLGRRESGLAVKVYGDTAGDLVAVVSHHRVFTRPFGSAWRKVERLPDDDNVIAVSPGPRVDALWRDAIGIRTASLKGHKWGPVVTLADRPDQVRIPLRAATNASGDVTFVWERWDDDYVGDDRVESVFRRAGTTEWTPVERVNRGSEAVDVAADSSDVGLAADGTMIVAWRETDRAHQYDWYRPILSATRAPSGEWSQPKPVGLKGRYLRVCLSVNAVGAAIVFTRTADETYDFLEWLAAAQRPAGASDWSVSRFTRKLQGIEGSWFEVDGVLSNGGEAVAIYQKTEEARIRSRSTLVT